MKFLAVSVFWAHGIATCEPVVDALTKGIPARPLHALTGSEFAKAIATLSREDREQAILQQVLEGNLPGFLRKLVPVRLEQAGRAAAATIFVMPEYLAIGSNRDFLRIPMNLHTAVAIANRFGFLLPTKKMVDAIYAQSRYHLTPKPMPAGPQMTSSDYYWRHNQVIEAQYKAAGISEGALVSGQKKDVVVTVRLLRHPGQIAIYGWHRAPGAPIQPLSTVHGAGYADYSHGIRLVSAMALVNGRLRPVSEILADARLAGAVTEEAPVRGLLRVLGLHADEESENYSRLLQQRNPR